MFHVFSTTEPDTVVRRDLIIRFVSEGDKHGKEAETRLCGLFARNAYEDSSNFFLPSDATVLTPKQDDQTEVSPSLHF